MTDTDIPGFLDRRLHPAEPIRPTKQSWRDVLPVHPAADLFPLMAETDPEGLKELGEDIEKNGLHVPIVMAKHEGKRALLDGRNRLDAMEMVGIRTLDERGGLSVSGAGWRYLPSDDDPYAYVISANIRRRHLTAEQKRRVIAKVIAAQPEKSNRQIAEMVKADHKTVAKARTEGEDVGTVPHVEKVTDTKGRQQPVRKGLSPREEATVEKVARVMADHPDIKTTSGIACRAGAGINAVRRARRIITARKRRHQSARKLPEPAPATAPNLSPADNVERLPVHTRKDGKPATVSARWGRGASPAEIAGCILGTLTYEPHDQDIAPLRLALEAFIARSR